MVRIDLGDLRGGPQLLFAHSWILIFTVEGHRQSGAAALDHGEQGSDRAPLTFEVA